MSLIERLEELRKMLRESPLNGSWSCSIRLAALAIWLVVIVYRATGAGSIMSWTIRNMVCGRFAAEQKLQ